VDTVGFDGPSYRDRRVPGRPYGQGGLVSYHRGRPGHAAEAASAVPRVGGRSFAVAV